MDYPDNLFKNVEEAKAYAKSLSNPVAKAMCWEAYATMMFKMGNVPVVGGFDLLYLFRLLNELSADQEQLKYLISLDDQDAQNVG